MDFCTFYEGGGVGGDERNFLGKKMCRGDNENKNGVGFYANTHVFHLSLFLLPAFEYIYRQMNAKHAEEPNHLLIRHHLYREILRILQCYLLVSLF